VKGLLLAAALALATPVPVAGAPAPSPLRRAAQAPGVVAYRGDQLVTVWLGKTTQVTLVHVEHDPRRWTRLEYRPVGLDRRWVILRRGDEEIRYDPTTRRGVRVPRRADEEPEETFIAVHWPLLEANYHIATTPVSVLGRPADRVELRPRYADRPTRRLSVDRATGIVLRSERISPDGRLIQLTAFLSFDLLSPGWASTNPVPTGLRLTRLAGTTSADAAARRLAIRPVEVATPLGFRRVADGFVDAPTPLWETTYSDGVSTLVVSRTPGTVPRPAAGSRRVDRAGGPVWVHESGLKHAVHWAYGGWLITMSGEVSPGSLLAAADRTGIAPPPRVLDRLLSWLQEPRP
jgi:hypothetical protein